MTLRLLTLLLALLLAPGDAAAESEAHSGSLLWHAFNLVVLIAALAYFARKPLLGFFTDRRRAIAQDLERSAQLLAEAEKRLADWERRLTRLDAELQEVHAIARESAESERQRILADAESAAGRIRRDAQAAVDQELRRARQALRADAADLAMKLAEKLLREQLDDSDRQRLVDDFVRRVESSPASPAATGRS